MKNVILLALAGMTLSACLGRPSARPVIVDQNSLSSADRSAVLWDCVLDSTNSAEQWRFMLVRDPSGKEVNFVEPGNPRISRTLLNRNGEAQIYTLPDKSEVLVASDGEVIATGPGRAKASTFTSGRCTRGSA